MIDDSIVGGLTFSFRKLKDLSLYLAENAQFPCITLLTHRDHSIVVVVAKEE